MSDISSLLFKIKFGLIANRDNGFGLSDFLLSFFTLSEEKQRLLRSVLASTIEELSKTKSVESEIGNYGYTRIDGTTHEVSDDAWCEDVKKHLRIFDDSYVSNESIKLMAYIASMDLNKNQKDFYNYRLLCARSVKVVPLEEVFTKEEISRIKKRSFIVKQCYRNSLLLASLFPDKVKYVEGEVLAAGVPIEHAFNKVGDKYVDVTLELALRSDVRRETYTSLLEVFHKEAVYLGSFTPYYGNYLFTKYKNSK